MDMKSSSGQRASLKRSCLMSILSRCLLSKSFSLQSNESLSGRLSLSVGEGGSQNLRN